MRNDPVRALSARAATVALLALLLCGCGDDDDKSAANHTPPTTGVAPPPPAPAPAPRPVPLPVIGAATVEWLAPETMTDGRALTNLVGYRIYYGTEVSRMTRSIDVKNAGVLSYVIEGLAPATYYFAVTAINSNGHESARSNAGRKIIT